MNVHIQDLLLLIDLILHKYFWINACFFVFKYLFLFLHIACWFTCIYYTKKCMERCATLSAKWSNGWCRISRFRSVKLNKTKFSFAFSINWTSLVYRLIWKYVIYANPLINYVERKIIFREILFFFDLWEDVWQEWNQDKKEN